MARFPFGIPNSWYVMAYSEDVPAGAVVRRHYLGRELVVFRGESGRASVFDAYCPHMGAHLGVGGQVVGDHLRCPFHGWRFDGDGVCVEIPYAQRVPPRAKLRAYPTIERNGMVFCWYDAQDRPPRFDVPDLSEWYSGDWYTPWIRHEWTVRTHPQEMAENGIDWPHFSSVHRIPSPEGPASDFRQHMYTWTVGGRKLVTTLDDTEDDLVMRGENWGLGYSFLRQTGRFDTLVASGLTPIDGETTVLRMGVIARKRGRSDDEVEGELRSYVAEHAVLAQEDFHIWENKRFRPEPLFCDGDGPIAEFRRWAAQFYE